MTEREPLRRREYIELLNLIGAVECTQETGTLDRRSDLLPDARARLADAYEQVLRTVPTDKLHRIRADLAHMKIYPKIEAPGISTVDETHYRYVPAETLNRLVDYMARNECLMCDMEEAPARKCPYRSVMENALPHELDYKAPDGCCKWSGLVLGLEGAG